MPASTLDPQNYAHPVWQLGIGLVYDSKVVTSPPKTPKDLADPQWKGQIAFDRVQNLGQSTTWLSVWKQQMGASAWESWIDDLQKQDIFIEPAASATFSSVQQGQKKIGISASNYVFSQPAGGTITMDFNIQVVPFYNHQYLTARAQHPASAKLFMEFASSATGQTAISTVGLSPIMSVDTPNTLAKFIPKDAAGLMPGTDESDFTANTATYSADLGKRWPG